MNVLISSAGRRVALAQCFRQSFKELNIEGRIVAIDTTVYSPAGQLADAYHVVPRCTDADFIPEVLSVCQKERVNLIVPTIDTELPVYARVREDFRQRGIHIAVAAPETVSICCDKIATHRWLEEHNFPAPRQGCLRDILQSRDGWRLPMVAKPRQGSASLGFRVVNSFDELEACNQAEDLIIQELISGAEHTVNLFVDRDGVCLTTVPHLRMEVRAGEVSKGLTVKDPRLMSLVKQIAETLPGAYGPLNVQCFLTPGGDVRVIEMNARFGGGYPLAHQAGAHMTTWLLEEAMGMKPCGPFGGWTNGLLMLRYDEAVFVANEETQHTTYADSVSRVRY
jgi:carbamoyl-phosphate synthase large subunit